MDSEILQKFVEEAESYIPTIRNGILFCSQNSKIGNDLELPIKQLHTIKGTSKLLGLKEINEIATDLENDLKILVENEKVLTEQNSIGVLDKLAVLEAQISQMNFGFSKFEIDDSLFIEEAFDNLQINKTEKIEVVEESVQAESTEDSFEDFEIDEEMLEIFAMEAEDHLQNINKNLELLEQDRNNREALLEIRRSSHTLKGSAGIVGLKTLSNLAHKVEDLLDYLSDNEIESNEEIFQLLLSATDCISAVTNNENSTELSDKINRTQDRFDELLNKLQNGEPLEKPKPQIVQPQKTEAEAVKEFKIESNSDSTVHTSIIPNTNSVIRVSLNKLDDLVKLVGEMIFSHSVFEQRLTELEQQISEFQNSTRRLQHSTGKLETSFDAGILGNRTHNFKTQNNFRSISTGNSTFEMTSNTNNEEFDSLEFDRYNEFNQTTRELIETTNDTLSINSELETIHNFFGILFDNQKRLIDEMQEKLLGLRMVTFGTLATRLQRTVRVTADEEHKLAELVIEGEGLEVDTQILDSLIDPLLHLLRNAVAHGIEKPDTRRLLGKNEKGKISLQTYSEGTHIVLKISDDGRGISPATLKEKVVELGLMKVEEAQKLTKEEALALIFLPGLTTAQEISQVSGRGVGMNIVKTNIERQNGTINIESEPQKGSTFIIRLPMALAVTRCLLVEANEYTFAFPLKLVKHIGEIAPKTLEKAKQEGNLRLGDVNYSISHLNELMGLPIEEKSNHQDVPLLLLETVKKPCALLVDKIIKPQEIVIKPLGNPLKDMKSILGATFLGDGSVVPVLDLIYLLDEQIPTVINTVNAKPKQKDKLSVMIVDDSPSVRHVNSKLIQNNNWLPVVAKDGVEALSILNNSKDLPDVILTDVEMPEMDGYELLNQLKQIETLKHIPVVMLTSRTSDKHQQKAYDLGVSDYLTKPYDDSTLVETIVRLSS